jgi:peptidoglycan hydrolase-like protein with peptidoglycan-binding domain
MNGINRDLSRSLDLLGLDSPFAEAGGVLEAEALEITAETPFANGLVDGAAERLEGFEPAAEFEKKAGPAHKFKDCTNTQKLLLIDVADRALTAVRHAASFVGSAHGRPDRMKPATRQLLLRHFHTTGRDDLRHILTRYMRIAKAIEDGIKFEGEKQCKATPTGKVCGYANMTQLFGGFGRVHICFDGRRGHCDFTSFPADQQEAIVIHEVAHRYVGIDDKAYLHEPKYATLKPKQALDNADSYAFFAVEGFATLKEAFEPEATASFDAVNEDLKAEDVMQFDALASFDAAEASEAEEGEAFSYDPQAESWSETLDAEELEAGFHRCAADESFAEEHEEELSESPAWTGTADQLAFRTRVLAEHIKRSTSRKGKPLRDLRDDELEKIPSTNIKTKTETARAAGRLLAAARAELAKVKTAGDADALRTIDVSVGSGYRGSGHQRELWLRYFGGYYNRTRAKRETLPGGLHSTAAVDYMLTPEKLGGFGLAGRIAAPGFSNHQNGIAIDFIQTRTSQPVGISTNKENRRKWSKTWFYGWLQRNAAVYEFEPYKKEEWHWEYKPKKSLSREAELQHEAAGGAVGGQTKAFLGGSIWSHPSRACATKVAVFVPPAALRGEKVDMMLYVHGLLSPCGAPKVMPEGIISEAPFKLGKLIVDSGRAMVLVVPRFQSGNDKSWSAHDLNRPGTLNALFAEVLGDMGRRLGRPAVQIDQLIIAGHSRAFGVLYPLARSHASPALAMGALAKLSKVWVLDATYGAPPMAAFEALAAARPGLGIDIIYRAPSPTNKFGGRSRRGPVALRPINPRSISHCAVPSKMLPMLMAELAAPSLSESDVPSGAEFRASPYWESAPSDRKESEQEEMNWEERLSLEADISHLDHEDEEESLETLPGDSLAWLDTEAGVQSEASEAELTEAEWFEPESIRSEWQEDAREQADEATAYDAETFATDMATLETLLEAEIGTGELADRLKGVAAFVVGPTLQRGSSGPAVEALQRALAQLGHPSGAADGRFGPATDQAVRAFQSKSGLPADGVVGPRTKAAIAAALGGGQTPPAPIPPTPVPPSPRPTPVDESLNAFATRLGAEWSRRKGGKPSADEKRDALLSDYEDTLKGARLRFGTKYSEEAIRRAWMISREEEMRFQTELSGGPLGDFGAPARRVELVSHASIGGSDKAPVAPMMIRFVSDLRRRYGPGASVGTYRGHGGGSFNDRGYSLDLFLSGRDARGFYRRDDALRLLRAVDGAAKAMPAKWRMIYNDFSVADAMNRETGRRNVIFVGSTRKDKNKRVLGLNWHGPDPLILHFHLDLAPLPGAEGEVADEAWSEEFSDSELDEVQFACEGEALADEVVALEGLLESEAGAATGLADRLKGAAEFMFGPTLKPGSSGAGVSSLQRALASLGADVAVDGSFGPNTERAVREFQTRSGLEADGIVGPATKAAIGAALGGRPAPSPTPPSPVPSPTPPSRSSGKKLTPRQFIAAYGAFAKASQAKNRVPALVTLGQAATESGWGESAPRFNFFGIKAKETDPEHTRQLLRTREVFARSDVKIPRIVSVTPRPDGRYTYVVDAWFRAYPDAATAFNAHGEFLVRNKRYAKAFTLADDPYAFADEVVRAGYATDPSYKRVLTSVMRMIEAAGGP